MNPDRDHVVASRVLLAQARRLINDACREHLNAYRHDPSIGSGADFRERAGDASSAVLELVRELDALLPDQRTGAVASANAADRCARCDVARGLHLASLGEHGARFGVRTAEPGRGFCPRQPREVAVLHTFVRAEDATSTAELAGR